MEWKALPLLTVVLLTVLASGCTIGTSDSVRLRGNVNPSQISLDKRIPVAIEASVENIGNTTQTISLDVTGTEGLSVEMPPRTAFTLKSGESRIVTFKGTLDETAVPGEYRVEISATADGGNRVKEVVFLKVVAERGLI